jgi:hypothetical protein
MIKPPPNVLELPMEVRAEMAMKAAVENLILEHARDGRSIFIWQDGKVVEVTAEELRANLAAAQ